MNLQDFLSSNYSSDSFESFIKECFYGLDIYDNSQKVQQKIEHIL